jgi:hypothetical protein
MPEEDKSDQKNTENDATLHQAVSNGQLPVMQKLLEKDVANAWCKNDAGQTIFDLATLKHIENAMDATYIAILKYLQTYQALQLALQAAIASNQRIEVSNLLSKYPFLARAPFESDQLPVDRAAAIGNLEAVLLLLNHGAKNGLSAAQIKSLIITAKTKSRLDIVDLLIQISAEKVTREKEIARGGQGIVYRGQYEGQPVALKVAFSKDIVIGEAVLLADLDHRNIIKSFGLCDEVAGLSLGYALVLEWVPNSTLAFWLLTKKLSDWHILYPVGVEIGHGLVYLHERGITHRDLKTENILMTDQMTPKLADLGIAKYKPANTTIIRPADGMSYGWASPEKLSNKPNIDEKKADVYSYAMVLWQLVSKEMPWGKFKIDEGSKKVIAGKIQDISKEMPPVMREQIKRGWLFEPMKRPEVASMVGAFLEEQSKNPLYQREAIASKP